MSIYRKFTTKKTVYELERIFGVLICHFRIAQVEYLSQTIHIRVLDRIALIYKNYLPGFEIIPSSLDSIQRWWSLLYSETFHSTIQNWFQMSPGAIDRGMPKTIMTSCTRTLCASWKGCMSFTFASKSWSFVVCNFSHIQVTRGEHVQDHVVEWTGYQMTMLNCRTGEKTWAANSLSWRY